MPQMGVAAAAADLGTRPAARGVDGGEDVLLRHRSPEARPTGPGVELRL